jgi:psp operon transcriptional activator
MNGSHHPSSGRSIAMDAIGQSEAFLDFQEKLSRVARINRPLLLMGERGTGKELAASRLHYLSLRWQEPLVALNCAALSPTLIESELFGHEKGAFTGATNMRKGRFEAADGGTLFLDEIGMIPLETQEKILRGVEYGTFERVGGSTAIDVDVRIVGATNADLLHLTRQGTFKRDLLDRLSFEVLFLPPLRERHGDIPLMADYFARRMAYELEREEMPTFSKAVLSQMETYVWKGNVRELKNVVERAVYRSASPLITRLDFDPFLSPYFQPEGVPEPVLPASSEPMETRVKMIPSNLPLKTAVRNLEISMLKDALLTTRHHQKKAAKQLGLTYDQFRGLMRKHKKEI